MISVLTGRSSTVQHENRPVRTEITLVTLTRCDSQGIVVDSCRLHPPSLVQCTSAHTLLTRNLIFPNKMQENVKKLQTCRFSCLANSSKMSLKNEVGQRGSKQQHGWHRLVLFRSVKPKSWWDINHSFCCMCVIRQGKARVKKVTGDQLSLANSLHHSITQVQRIVFSHPNG